MTGSAAKWVKKLRYIIIMILFKESKTNTHKQLFIHIYVFHELHKSSFSISIISPEVRIVDLVYRISMFYLLSLHVDGKLNMGRYLTGSDSDLTWT